MFKLLVATVLAAGVVLSVPLESRAATNVKIYLGVPHYSYRVAPDYVYRKGQGWYRPVRARISCERGRNIVRNQGFRNVDRVECSGPTYTYRATRNGKRLSVYVNSRTGGVWR